MSDVFARHAHGHIGIATWRFWVGKVRTVPCMAVGRAGPWGVHDAGGIAFEDSSFVRDACRSSAILRSKLFKSLPLAPCALSLALPRSYGAASLITLPYAYTVDHAPGAAKYTVPPALASLSTASVRSITIEHRASRFDTHPASYPYPCIAPDPEHANN
jgi:hypothetical protein